MADPRDHDERTPREPAVGAASEVYRLHVGGAPGLLGESLAEMRRARPGLLAGIAGAAALIGVALVAFVVASARR
ncbi:hypothetical protein [Agrococcus jejuensis]|uniref:Uncharacterized protein n=1 Tax=Agrococcus jejuensis TaxID=399736 RepID=A0A1G8F0J0_9MICO|nr:hypothetical protein [Agrococcus jejuensis]SDH75645.1 hypothetical protein SAMN04489720_2272 [Agrococcus jejuensis]